jgi:hypothetical protein
LVATVAATNPHLHAKDIGRAVNAILEEITAAPEFASPRYVSAATFSATS